ncbi:hypothetical protein MTO96_019308 [Rhipicephalus appendiculatus]
MKRSNERRSAVLYHVPLNSLEASSADEITEQEYSLVDPLNDRPFSMYSGDLSEPTTRDSKFKSDRVSTHPSTSKTSSSAPRDYAGQTKATKTKASDIKGTRHERSRRNVIMIASGWTEVFTTITEEPTTEEITVNVPSFSSKRSSLKTSTLTSKGTVVGSSTEAPAMTSEEPTAITTESTSGEHTSETLEYTPQRGRLRGQPPYSSMYQDPWEDAWNSSSTRLQLEKGSTWEDSVEEVKSSAKGTSETAEASPLWPIQLQNIEWIRRAGRHILDTFDKIVSVLSSSVAPGTWTDRTDVTSSIEPFGLDEASYEWKGDERTSCKPYREQYDACDMTDNSVGPGRGILLVLTVGLLVATFIIASLLFVRFRYQTQLPQESAARYFHVKMNVNGTLYVEKSHDALEKAAAAVEETLGENGDVSAMPMTTMDET